MEQVSFTYQERMGSEGTNGKDQSLKINLYNIDENDFAVGQELTCYVDPDHVVVLPGEADTQWH